MTYQCWLQSLQGLLTPVIGLTTLYIAWQQWNGNKLKLRLDRYERRLRVYQSVASFLVVTLKDFKPEVAQVQGFRVATAEAAFLFGPDIHAYLDEIAERAMKLWKANQE